MRKIKTSEGIDLIILPEDRFSIFSIKDNPLRIDQRSQDDTFFYEQSCFVYLPCSHWESSIYNSGQRNLEIFVNSEEEDQFLKEYFRSRGFRIISSSIFREGSGLIGRVYINPEELVVDSFYFADELFGCYSKFCIRLEKSQYYRFLDCLKELSNSYNYKTQYQDGNDFKMVIIK